MTTQTDPKDLADEFCSDIGYMRTLLGAAEDKVDFYLENRKLLGPNGELLYCCARELDDLLELTGRHLKKMEDEMDVVTDFLYGIEQSAE